MGKPKVWLIGMLLAIPLLVAIADRAWTQVGASGPVLNERTNGIFASYQFEESAGFSTGGTYTSQPDGSVGMGTGGTYYSRRSATVEVRQVEGMSSGGTYKQFELTFSVSVEGTAGYGYADGNCFLPAGSVISNHGGSELSVSINTAAWGCSLYQYGTVSVPYPQINLTWDRNSAIWNHMQGNSVRQIGDYVIQSQGTSLDYWADVTGSVTLPPLTTPGTPFVNSWLGTRNTRDTIFRRGQ
jgi:hypothetical protein